MEPTAKFSVQCWGCNQSVEMPYSSVEDMQNKLDVLKAQGWRRRTFGNNINASPWFCCEDCATNSYNAKQAEEWWAQKEFEEYCNRQLIHPRYYGLLGIAAFAAILVVAALLQECINAGAQ